MHKVFYLLLFLFFLSSCGSYHKAWLNVKEVEGARLLSSEEAFALERELRAREAGSVQWLGSGVLDLGERQELTLAFTASGPSQQRLDILQGTTELPLYQVFVSGNEGAFVDHPQQQVYRDRERGIAVSKAFELPLDLDLFRTIVQGTLPFNASLGGVRVTKAENYYFFDDSDTGRTYVFEGEELLFRTVFEEGKEGSIESTGSFSGLEPRSLRIDFEHGELEVLIEGIKKNRKIDKQKFTPRYPAGFSVYRVESS